MQGESDNNSVDVTPGQLLQSKIKELERVNLELMKQITALESDNERLTHQITQNQHSINQYKSYVENANDIIATLSLDGVITYVSPNWTEILGHEISEVIGQPIFEKFIHPDDVAATLVFFKNTIDSGIKRSGIEYRIRHKDGLWRWHSANASPIFDDNDKVVSFLAIGRDITQNKVEAEHLIQTRARLAEAQRIGKFGNWEWTPADNKVVWSEGMYHIFGVEPGTLITTDKSIEAFYPEDIQKVLESTKRAVETGMPQPIECRFFRPDGSIGYVFGTGEAKLDDKGNLVKMIGIYQDITERKLNEERTMSTKRFYESLIQKAPDGVVLINPEGAFNYASPAALRMFGYKESEALTTSPDFNTHPEDLAMVLTTLNEVLINPQMVSTIQYRYRKKDGAYLWIESTFSNMLNEPDVNAIVINFRDITERRLAELKIVESEELLKASESSYRSLFNSMVEGFALHECICDENGTPVDYRFLLANPSFEKLTGLKISDIRGKTALQIIPNLEPFWIERYGKVAITGEPITFEDYIKALDKYYSVVAFSNQPGQFAVLIEDVTEQKKLEEQLLASQKMDALGRLSGGIAHDFNNLLTVILGYSEGLILELPENSILRNDVEEILKAGKRASNLTRQLLTFSKQQFIQPRIINLNVVVKEMEKMLIRIIGEDISFTLDLDNELRNIKIDHGQIEQVIMNLVLNARDAMPNGGILSIKTKNTTMENLSDSQLLLQESEYTLLEIIDTGLGIEPDTLNRMFEPFFTTKKPGKGTGLGLSTVYGIITQIGGKIEVESKIGTGTLIRLLIPATHEEEALAEKSIEDINLKGSGEHILIVEDEESLCILLRNMIEKANYKVVMANSGEAALEALNKGLVFDLVITDVVMPGINGKELYDRIKAIYPDQKVLFMSGYVDNSIVSSEVLNHDIPFIQKPFISEEISYLIKKQLSGSDLIKHSCVNILMIDDEDDVRVLVRRSFSKRGHHFKGVSNLEEALVALQETQFDVLLIDVKLIGMMGIEALQEIRKAGFKTPAIMYTGVVNADDFELTRNLGVLHIFEKSFNHQPLIHFIEDYIEKKH